MTEQEKFEDIIMQAGGQDFLVKDKNGKYIKLATAAMFEVFELRQPEIDALRKELEQVKELHKDALILLEQEECRHDETKEKLEHVKMHNVMFAKAAKFVHEDLMIRAKLEGDDSLNISQSALDAILSAITATSEQVETYRAEIIAQAKEEQREADAKFCLRQDGMHDHIYAEAIRNNKE